MDDKIDCCILLRDGILRLFFWVQKDFYRRMFSDLKEDCFRCAFFPLQKYAFRRFFCMKIFARYAGKFFAVFNSSMAQLSIRD
jgi:hypothetical protein